MSERRRPIDRVYRATRRNVILARYDEGRKIAAIAAEFAVSVSCVKTIASMAGHRRRAPWKMKEA